MRKRITKALVDTLPAGSLAWDTEVPRFAVRRQSTARVYLVKYRTDGRRQRWFRIGEHGSPWTPDTARKEASRILGLVAQGQDPAAVRIDTRTAPTVADLCDRFLSEHTPKLRPSTAAEYRKTINGIIKPKLGRYLVGDVTRADLARLHHAMVGTPAHANRVLALCSKLFNVAERWGLRPDGSNPSRHVERFKERKRERYLSGDELARLGAVLAAAERDGHVIPKDGAPAIPVNPFALAGVKLLLFTGARRGEILSAKWEYLDAERGVLRLPESKTGSKTVSLNGPALAILDELPRIDGNPYLFPSLTRDEQHMVRVHDAWDAIRTAAGLEDVRLHDLRHSHASIGVSAGASLPIVGRLLGHTVPQTTQRYAHVAPDPVREASELIGARIAAAMNGGQAQKRRKRRGDEPLSFSPTVKAKLGKLLRHLADPAAMIATLERHATGYRDAVSVEATLDALYTTRRQILLDLIEKTKSLLSTMDAARGTAAWNHDLTRATPTTLDCPRWSQLEVPPADLKALAAAVAAQPLGAWHMRRALETLGGECDQRRFVDRLANDLGIFLECAWRGVDHVKELEDMARRPKVGRDGRAILGTDGRALWRHRGGRPGRKEPSRYGIVYWIARELAEAPRRPLRRGELALARARGSEDTTNRSALRVAVTEVLSLANDRPHVKDAKKLHEHAWDVFVKHWALVNTPHPLPVKI
jgi:integrase